MRRIFLTTLAVNALLACNDGRSTDDAPPANSRAASPKALPSTAYWVFAHPDDETLAASSRLQAHQTTNDRNVIVFVTDGPMTSVRTVLWPKLENDDRARQNKCRQARYLESTAALVVQGIERNDIIRFGYAEGQFTVADVKARLRSLMGDSTETVRLQGHSPCDTYGPGLGGHSDHRKVSKALYELYLEGGYPDVGFYRIGHLDGAFECGVGGQGHVVPLTRSERTIKLQARDEYTYPVDFEKWNWRRGSRWNYEHTQPAVQDAVASGSGRYGIAGLSVPRLWKAIETQPECEDFPEEGAVCYASLVDAYPLD